MGIINTNKPDLESKEFQDKWMKKELKKKEAHNKIHSERLQLLVDLGAPDAIIKEQKRILNLSILDYEYELKQKYEAEENYRIEYLKKHPENPEEIKEIYKQFDLWFERYKDDLTELHQFHHWFVEPWYQDTWCPWKKLEYHTLNLGEVNIRYSEVFDKLQEQVYDRLKILVPKFVMIGRR